jgi:hypothetical protein
MHLKLWLTQDKPKFSIWEGIIKIKEDINEMETKKDGRKT